MQDELGLKILTGNFKALPNQSSAEPHLGPLRPPPQDSPALTGEALAALSSSPITPKHGAVAASAFGVSIASPASKVGSVARSIAFRQPGGALSTVAGSGESCDGSDMADVVPKASTDEIRKMNAHQKAQYWAGRISIRACVSGNADRKCLRQGKEHVARTEGTTDPTLKKLVEELDSKLLLAAKAEWHPMQCATCKMMQSTGSM